MVGSPLFFPLDGQTKGGVVVGTTSSNSQNDFDPQVDLQINESLIPKVVLDFGSQVNILTKDIWEKLGRPQLVKYHYYIKLVDQGLIEP